ncbi:MULTISPECIES: tetratricopeptide repeat protein [unclassified Lysobacter]|uniref:YfgM family protein n=1 Tax=unclassified Lysobacter TaxID=2635362 RepID=UPI001C22F224|nr:tetratricopeptide repeat protein [Lysobacter sp. MMG2]MBU8974613.1 tetratricopeptide repeat protein [Lysobacter sp. MMG2]
MAIDDLLDEHEQSERVLQWLRNNGAGLIGGIALGLAAIGGWKWWEHRGEQQRMDTATQYQSALDAIEAKDKGADAKVKALADGSSYHALASLELARSQVDAKQNDAALATLRGIHSNDPAIMQIVNLRIARLLIESKQADAALKLVADADTASGIEVRGDAHLALGQKEQARTAYTEAMAKLDVASPHRRLLELKLTEVGGTPAKPEAKS